MKRLLIRVEGQMGRPHRIQIREGTRVSDIRNHLKLNEDYPLALASTPHAPLALCGSRNSGKTRLSEGNLYGLVH